MKKRPRTLAAEEVELFRSAVADARPLKHEARVDLRPPPPAPYPHMREEDERQVLKELFSDEYHPLGVETGEEIVFTRPGIQHNTLRKLRRGAYSVEAELDLHGMTVAIAREALAFFLLRALDAGLRCVRVIHGKGRRSSNQGPVLKGKVDRWLRQRDEVLAFCSARPVDGGTGALYVLLKRA